MTNTIFIIPLLKFLINLLIGCLVTVASIYILVFSANIVISLIVTFLFGGGEDDE